MRNAALALVLAANLSLLLAPGALAASSARSALWDVNGFATCGVSDTTGLTRSGSVRFVVDGNHQMTVTIHLRGLPSTGYNGGLFFVVGDLCDQLQQVTLYTDSKGSATAVFTLNTGGFTNFFVDECDFFPTSLTDCHTSATVTVGP